MYVKRWRNAALLCVGSGLFFWQLRHPIILFSSRGLNDFLGFGVALILPWLIAVAVFRIGRRWSKAIAIVAVLPLLLYTLVWTVDGILTGYGSSIGFDRFAETQWRGSAVRLYRINGGATTDFGVVIRQERILVPGVMLVRTLDSFYPCESLDPIPSDYGIAVTDDHSNCKAFPGQRREYRLKHFVYF